MTSRCEARVVQVLVGNAGLNRVETKIEELAMVFGLVLMFDVRQSGWCTAGAQVVHRAAAHRQGGVGAVILGLPRKWLINMDLCIRACSQVGIEDMKG